MKYNKKLIRYLPFAFLLLVPLAENQAQSLKRQNIGGLGTTVTSGDYLVLQTIGQPYSTVTHHSTISILPGFQQPESTRLRTTSNESELVKLSIYPNPAVNIVSIETGDITNALIQVTSSDGRVILKENSGNSDTYTINCEKWPAGFYLISVYSDQGLKYSSSILISK